MKKRIIRLTALVMIIAIVFATHQSEFLALFNPKTVRAFGDLTVDFHVPTNAPIFTITNMAPGQMETRNVDVNNTGSVDRMVSVKGVKTSETGNLSNVLSIVISEGSTDLYGGTALGGPKHLSDFFADSSSANGIMLSTLQAGHHTTYIFKVTFDSSAGNAYQNKQVIFDLTFGEVTGNNVVINEVFYNVDAVHGLDSPGDRGVTVGGISTSIIGNGAGSVNKIFIDIDNNCSINQVNNSSTTTTINQNANTGNNSANGNTGGTTIIQTGSITQSVSVTNKGNVNSAQCSQGKKLGQNDEWVELFNPTDHDISLKNYSFVDNSGIVTKINGNFTIKSLKFALVSKDNSTWTHWSVPAGTLKIPLGHQIGDGLNNSGDHLTLNDAANHNIDALSWGNDTTIFTLSGVLAGHSLSRNVPGLDTDSATDWHDQNPPTPGS